MPITPIDLNDRYINDPEAVSNLKSVHLRDDAGNIILNSGSIENSVLVIEPIKKRYTVSAVARVLDTNFEYYSFPVQTIETYDNASAVDIANNSLDQLLTEIDTYAGEINELNDTASLATSMTRRPSATTIGRPRG